MRPGGVWGPGEARARENDGREKWGPGRSEGPGGAVPPKRAGAQRNREPGGSGRGDGAATETRFKWAFQAERDEASAGTTGLGLVGAWAGRGDAHMSGKC
jgi:hypothetical protein